jgi:hypothetical protein
VPLKPGWRWPTGASGMQLPPLPATSVRQASIEANPQSEAPDC